MADPAAPGRPRPGAVAARRAGDRRRRAAGVALVVTSEGEGMRWDPRAVLRQLAAASELADALRGLELLALGGDPGLRLRYRPGGDWSVRIELPLEQLALILASL